MNSNFQEVKANYRTVNKELNYEIYDQRGGSNGKKLIDFHEQLRIVTTENKWSTWGRTYIEIPIEVLSEFDIFTCEPITIYINYVLPKKYRYCYLGDIFSGDAAWFDLFKERKFAVDLISKNEVFKFAESVLENHEGKQFIDHFDSQREKWAQVAIVNIEKVLIASRLNNHL